MPAGIETIPSSLNENIYLYKAVSREALIHHTVMMMVCCFANDCCYVMDERLAASTTFRDCNRERRVGGWLDCTCVN